MSGTSMACPVACAALASWLSKDQAYLSSARDLARAQRAGLVFAMSLQRLPLNPIYVGGGIPTALP
jgi:hypothetical protein